MDASRFSQLRICEDDKVIDRLSELPDSLILSILSFLSMFDVVRTTILSKRWKDLWATIPCLHFCFSDDYHFRYVDFISGALAKWKGAKMLKFSLSLQFDDDSFHSNFHSWLLFAIEKQVEEFFIDVHNWGFGDFTPQRFYSCSSITKLSLAIFSLNIIVDKVQWDNLKSLTLRVEASLSEDAMNQVLCGAPHLEELILTFSFLSEIINIRSTSLKTLKIDADDVWFLNFLVLEIWAPDLVTLELSARNYCGCSLVVPSLTNATLSFQNINWEIMPCKNFNQVFRSISHVEKLTLSEWCIKLLLLKKNTNMDVPVSNAKFLKFYLHEAEEMLDVFVIFPELMHTIVADQPYTNKDISYFVFGRPEQLDTADYHGACFRSPSLVELKTVEITWPVGDASIFRVIEYLLENAHKLEKMVLRLRMAGANPETFVLAEEKVRSMPRSSPTAQLIITSI